MRLQKQQLAFLVACAVVSAKHIRRFLRDQKIIYIHVCFQGFNACQTYLQQDPVYHNWHDKMQEHLYFMCFEMVKHKSGTNFCLYPKGAYPCQT